MEYTKNLKLHKPSYDDDVDIQVLNNNMDILDDRVGKLPYLPLAGGTMRGNIILPYNINNYIGLNVNNKIEFNETSFHTVKKPTCSISSDRFKFYTASKKEFVIEDDGVYFDNDALICDVFSDNADFSGVVKLSTGLLLQWGFVNPKGSTYNVQHATFKTPMKSPSYVVLTSRSFYTGGLPSNRENRWGSVTFNFTTTGFDICCAEPSAYGTAEFWLAIGRYK